MGITKIAFDVRIRDGAWYQSHTERVYLHPTMESYGDMELYSVFAKRLGVDPDDVLGYTELDK